MWSPNPFLGGEGYYREEEATVICTLFGPPGVREAAHRAQSHGVGGEPLDSTAIKFPWVQQPRREFISDGEGFRVSDEAVVSDDPTGQHNPMAGKGLWMDVLELLGVVPHWIEEL